MDSAQCYWTQQCEAVSCTKMQDRLALPARMKSRLHASPGSIHLCGRQLAPLEGAWVQNKVGQDPRCASSLFIKWTSNRPFTCRQRTQWPIRERVRGQWGLGQFVAVDGAGKSQRHRTCSLQSAKHESLQKKNK